MELDEFRFIYDDMKAQSKEISSLPLLLKSIEKSTKKLDCINLYSAIDRRDLDFQLFEKDIYEEIAELVQQIHELRSSKKNTSLNMERMISIQQRIEKIKDSKMKAFDQLDKMEENLQLEIDKLVDQQFIIKPSNISNEIKEVEEDEEEQQEVQKVIENSANRVESLKLEIQQLNRKITKLNRGKGKWFDGDHNDFLKLYSRYTGDAEKIIEEGVKVLGMKNIQIVDHLSVYETYLQLEKEKKLVNEEFKTIKMIEKEIRNQQEISHQLEIHWCYNDQVSMKLPPLIYKRLQLASPSPFSSFIFVLPSRTTTIDILRSSQCASSVSYHNFAVNTATSSRQTVLEK